MSVKVYEGTPTWTQTWGDFTASIFYDNLTMTVVLREEMDKAPAQD